MRQGLSTSAKLEEQLKELYLNYTSGNSQNEGFRNYVWQKAEASVLHIQNFWKDLMG